MVREDLVASAVEFLRDPSAAASPLESRIAFLRSKNLSQQEIDVALARSGQTPASSISPQSYGNQQPMMHQASQSYGQYPGGYWNPPPPPPEIPRRDWRDWFIMATVVGGVSYGLFTVAKRYVYPIIAPPTPAQLEQDKKAIDESFTKAFDLLDQLVKDTEELKQAEKARTERLDAALEGVAHVTGELKASIKDRENDSRRMNDDIKNLRDLIPKAMEAQKEQADERLKELNTELKSLKTLVGTRMALRNSPASTTTNGSVSSTSGPTMNGASSSESEKANENGKSTGQTANSISPIAPGLFPTRSDSASSFGKPVSGNRAAIPAWQMAAAQKTGTSPEAPSVEEASS